MFWTFQTSRAGGTNIAECPFVRELTLAPAAVFVFGLEEKIGNGMEWKQRKKPAETSQKEANVGARRKGWSGRNDREKYWNFEYEKGDVQIAQ